MPQISTTIQNLLNGVSQQADSQRFPSQAEEQINGLSSPVLGLSKRNPTEHITKVVWNEIPTDVWAQVLNRDATERYMVLVRNSVSYPIGALTGGSALNGFTADSATITVTGHGFVDDDEVRFYGGDSSVGNPTNLSFSNRYYVVNAATDTIEVSATKGGSAIVMVDGGSGAGRAVSLDPIVVWDLVNNVEKTVATTDASDYLVSATPSTSLKATSIADYSFMVNTDTTVAMDADTSTDNRYRYYVYVKQGDYGTKYTIKLAGTEYTHETPDGSAADVRDEVDTTKIAEELYDLISALSGYTITRQGSTIEIFKDDLTEVEITVADGLGDSALEVVGDETDDFTKLPLYCRHGQQVKIIGDPETGADDYYVKFAIDAPSDTIGKGKWSEDVAPGLAYKIDGSTFCHTLIREADGDFTFKEGVWNERMAGDDDTNKDPSFVGEKIKNITLYRDRLGFLSGENISMSEAGEYFNFFRTTVTQTLGTDFVDIRASHNKVANLKSAVPFSRNLILLSDRTQFMLTGGDVLTPETVSMSQETEYEVDTTADPVVSGSSIYFPFNRGDFAGLMEYFISPDTEQMSGVDVSAHIPTYIDGNITKMASHTSDPVVAVTTTALTNGFFVYRYLYRGKDRIQSSWSKFTLDTGCTIRNLDFIEKDLYLVVQRTDGVYIEKMSFKEGDSDSDSEYKTLLDRRVTEAECTITYDVNTQKSTIVLPYTSYGTINVCTRADSGSGEESGTRFVVTQSGNTDTVTVDEDLTSRKLWVGDGYSFDYTLNKPYLKVSTEQGTRGNAGSGRFQVRNGNLTYDNSASFKVRVTPEGRPERVYPFESRTLNTSGFTLGQEQVLKDGIFKFPVKSKGSTTTIRITNDTPFPCALLTMEYEATYYSRFKQV